MLAISTEQGMTWPRAAWQLHGRHFGRLQWLGLVRVVAIHKQLVGAQIGTHHVLVIRGRHGQMHM
ncbi:hypothetical protein APX70_04237 [Pseudomonas syringae pv. maculicola]|uniref:Uncharacterized protein n=1 Tax=Pseudomonas syringae pv. maculicola TaxID=59511 RepID=A0A3M2ZAD3_PSEYM|nr:hypothetical protein APX70_04237 [Pseudomonas syringae pv. maculicola]